MPGPVGHPGRLLDCRAPWRPLTHGAPTRPSRRGLRALPSARAVSCGWQGCGCRGLGRVVRATPDTEPGDCVYLSQRDVRELQFGKAAIATGWALLLEELGLEQSDVAQVLLAGSFGSYLSPASAVRIGLVPKLPVLRIVSAGNVAGEGAKMVLLSLRERVGAQALVEEVRYVELSDRPDFNDKFVDQLSFPTP